MVAARTAPNRAVRFGGEHAELDARGRRDAAGVVIPGGVADLVVGPETSVRQTADLIGGRSRIELGLRSLAVGRWQGVGPQDLPSDELAAWFADPSWTGHGGESVAAFVARIRRAVLTVDAATAVVAKPVAQALLCDDVTEFFAVDVRPAHVYLLSP